MLKLNTIGNKITMGYTGVPLGVLQQMDCCFQNKMAQTEEEQKVALSHQVWQQWVYSSYPQM